MGTTNILDMNNRINALEKDVTSVEEAVDEVAESIPLIRKGIFQVNGAGTTPVSNTIVYSEPFPTVTDIVLLSVRRDSTDTSPENGVARVRVFSKTQFIYTFTGNNNSSYYVDYIAFGH